MKVSTAGRRSCASAGVRRSYCYHRRRSARPKLDRAGAPSSSVHPTLPRTPHPRRSSCCPHTATERVRRRSGGVPAPRSTTSFPPSTRASMKSSGSPPRPYRRAATPRMDPVAPACGTSVASIRRYHRPRYRPTPPAIEIEPIRAIRHVPVMQRPLPAASDPASGGDDDPAPRKDLRPGGRIAAQVDAESGSGAEVQLDPASLVADPESSGIPEIGLDRGGPPASAERRAFLAPIGAVPGVVIDPETQLPPPMREGVGGRGALHEEQQCEDHRAGAVPNPFRVISPHPPRWRSAAHSPRSRHQVES